MSEPLSLLRPMARLLTGAATLLIAIAACALGVWLEGRREQKTEHERLPPAGRPFPWPCQRWSKRSGSSSRA